MRLRMVGGFECPNADSIAVDDEEIIHLPRRQGRLPVGQRDMSDPVGITRGRHRTFFKWHRARRRASDPAFTRRRVLEGLALGASVEVDLVVHGGQGFAVLHDHLSIARETTGHGASRDHSGEALRKLNLRANDGTPIADHVMLLEDLCAMLVATPPHPEAMLQLDYKEGQGPLDAATIATFAKSVAPVARTMILSSGDAEPVRLLSDAAPGVRIGHDPCHDETLAALERSRDYAGFVAEAVAASPKAEMIYLAYPVVLAAADSGFDMIDAFHRGGRRVDAYTVEFADAATRPTVERLLDLRVDQITTDDPEGLGELIEGA